jgi:patatin-like phospholipase/acyl hydrolase
VVPVPDASARRAPGERRLLRQEPRAALIASAGSTEAARAHSVVAEAELLGEKYDAAGLVAVLEECFGDTRLGEAITETLVTSYDLETREPWFFARHKARKDPAGADFPMRFVARATSAAPTYFEPEELVSTKPPGGMIDG